MSEQRERRNVCRFIGWMKKLEMRYAASGLEVTKFGMNVGSKQKPCWIDLVAFGKLAERTNSIGENGKVAIEAYVQQEKWTDKRTGQNRSKHSFVVTSIDEADSTSRGEDRGPMPPIDNEAWIQPPDDATPF